MERVSEVVIAIATVVISSAALFLLAAGVRRLIGAGIQVQIVIGEHETTVTVEGSEIFRTSSRVKCRALDGEHLPRIVGLSGDDDPSAEDHEEGVFDYDFAAVDQPASKGVLDAFIIGCCWRARQRVTPLAVLGGVNVIVVLNLTEERRAQLLQELNPREISDATGARVSIAAAA